MLTGVSPRNNPESRSIVSTRRCSVISRTVRVFGMATSMPDCSTGAVIMKITSSTSTTSTSGVILISAREVRVCPVLLVKATFNLVGHFAARQLAAFRASHALCRRSACRTHLDLFQGIQQLAAEVVDGRRKYPDAGSELVVGHHCGHSNKQSGSGCNQRLGDTGRHRAQRCCARGA